MAPFNITKMRNLYDNVKPSLEGLPERVEELFQEFYELKSFLQDKLPAHKPKSEWMTPSQLADYMNVSKQWVYQRTRTAPEELPPMHRHGGRILFSTSEVDTWIMEGGAS